MSKAKKAILEAWLIGRPKVVKELARKFPPWESFVLKGQEEVGVYQPIAYSEDGTIRCLKTDFLGFQVQVFGMKPSDLIPAKELKNANNK